MPHETIGLLDAIYTTRTIRRFKPDPIPDEVLHELLDAAIRAPNGSNNQTWRFLVIKDPELRRQVGEQYRLAYQEYNPANRLELEPDPNRQRLIRSSQHLAATMGTEPPVLVLFCAAPAPNAPQRHPGAVVQRSRGSSVYPAFQNMMLAARLHGIGGCLTTIYLLNEQRVKEILGIPDEVDTFALVPLGYAASPFGPVRRQPVEEVAFVDRWGGR